MTFTQDWFSRDIVTWKRILVEFKGKPNLRFLEIGCFEGRATEWLLKNILTNKTSNITVIDTFKGSEEHKGLNLSNLEKTFKKNVAENFPNQVCIEKGQSQLVLRKYSLNSKFKYFDFAYIDGSHNAPDVIEDAVLTWRLLKKGGILIFDDYKWPLKLPALKKPKIAIDYFMILYKGKYKLIHSGYQIAIRKI